MVAPAPADLDDRRVEITGPAEPKMMINALNSGARVFMADLEDALSPTWANVIEGQAAIADATRGTLTFDSPEGKAYRLDDDRATLVVRPRGWHLIESHVLVDGVPVSASLFDFGLYLFHSGAAAIEAGSGPYVYLPKLESPPRGAALERRVPPRPGRRSGSRAGRSGRPSSSRRSSRPSRWTRSCTSCASTPRASTPAAGTTCSVPSRSSARTRRSPRPDRAQLTMTVPFMRAYTELLVQTCHRRGAHAIGGMAAFIPNRRDPVVTETALEKVRADKERESRDGFDGTWVAHPDLVPSRSRSSMASWAPGPNQKERRREEVAGRRRGPAGPDRRRRRGSPKPACARTSGSPWPTSTRGCAAIGAAAIDNLMEDAATAEISRSQLWLWITQGVVLDDGTRVRSRTATRRSATRSWIASAGRATGRLAEAADLLDRLVLDDDFAEFLTLRAYALLE